MGQLQLGETAEQREEPGPREGPLIPSRSKPNNVDICSGAGGFMLRYTPRRVSAWQSGFEHKRVNLICPRHTLKLTEGDRVMQLGYHAAAGRPRHQPDPSMRHRGEHSGRCYPGLRGAGICRIRSGSVRALAENARNVRQRCVHGDHSPSSRLHSLRANISAGRGRDIEQCVREAARKVVGRLD
jgi:hypothetical protein